MRKLQRMWDSFRDTAFILLIVSAGLGALGIALAIVGALIGWPIGIAMLYPLIQPYQDQVWFQVIGTGVCILAAWFMFWLRKSMRHAYAVVEIVCAVTVLWYAVGHQKTAAMFGPTILAGIYIAVRGLDNWITAGREENREKVTFRSAVSHADAIQAEINRIHEQNKDFYKVHAVSDVPIDMPVRDVYVERLEVRFRAAGPEFVVIATKDIPVRDSEAEQE